MQDQSFLDRKYFIDGTVYNCPFCNRNNVIYHVMDQFEFNWSENKKCYGFITACSSCEKCSMHLSYVQLTAYSGGYPSYVVKKDYTADIDSYIFYSVPTSFFVLDERIPRIIRELITEAEGCLKMNFLTGASACMRKAIYELLIFEKCEGIHYDEKIKFLKQKYPNSDQSLFDILAHIQDMTSDKIHEQSWDKWDPNYLKLIIETLKTVLYDIYVVPKIKAEKAAVVLRLREEIDKSKKEKSQLEINP